MLGMGSADSPVLQERLQEAAREQEAVAGEVDRFGRRYVIDFTLEYLGRRALVLSAWIVLVDNDSPRLTSCYVLRGL